MKSTNSPHEVASSLLQEIVNDLSRSPQDIKLTLRKTIHVCDILGWKKQRNWLHKQLNGYVAEGELPNYRIATGSILWSPKHKHQNPSWLVAKTSNAIPQDLLEKESVNLNIWDGVDFIKSCLLTGYSETTGEERQLNLGYPIGSFELERVKFFPAWNFKRMINKIESEIFDFVSRALVQLEFGEAISDFWSEVRNLVDAKLHEVGFQNHLKAIDEGLVSDNPEQNRASLFACRSLLTDLADFLWQDTRSQYEFLPGSREGKLDVVKGKSKNRLSAYLHQKRVSGKAGTHLNRELERLSEALSALIEQQSKAHGPVSRQEANFIALKTYIAIGELVNLTDMIPVTKYQKT